MKKTKIISVALSTILTLSLVLGLSSCSSEVKKETVLEGMQKTLENVKNVSYKVQLISDGVITMPNQETEASSETQETSTENTSEETSEENTATTSDEKEENSFSLKMNLSGDFQQDSLHQIYAKLKMTTKTKMFGKDLEQSIITENYDYLNGEGDETYSEASIRYLENAPDQKSANSAATTKDKIPALFTNLPDLKTLAEKLTFTSREENDKKYYLLEGTIPFNSFTSAMSPIAGLNDQTKEVPTSIKVDSVTLLPIEIHFDMTKVVEEQMKNSPTPMELKLDTMTFDITNITYDTIDRIEIPQNILQLEVQSETPQPVASESNTSQETNTETEVSTEETSVEATTSESN